LIAGGVGTGYPDTLLANAELYDPSTGTFTPAGHMNTARFAHTATLLSDGKVLIDGSHPEAESGSDSSELYDPETGTFQLIPRTSYGGAETATVLMDGRVLVTRSVEGTPEAELYEVSTGAFAPTRPMGDRFRSQYTATPLPAGTVLIAGGNSGEALLYNPVTGTFSPAGNMAVYRRWHTATLLSDGSVLIAGGYETPPVSLNSAQLYTSSVIAPSTELLALGKPEGPQYGLNQTHNPKVDHRLVRIAIEKSERFRISYRDASILAAAKARGAGTVYSEDLNDGQRYGHVRVVNPFQ
jgi:hypothetical protein